MSYPVAPHFDIPFRFVGHKQNRAVVNEQGNIDDLQNCVYLIVVTPQGWRDEVPKFGTPDPTFDFLPVMKARLQESIQEQDRRTSLAFIEWGDEMMRNVTIAVDERRGRL